MTLFLMLDALSQLLALIFQLPKSLCKILEVYADIKALS